MFFPCLDTAPKRGPCDKRLVGMAKICLLRTYDDKSLGVDKRTREKPEALKKSSSFCLSHKGGATYLQLRVPLWANDPPDR